jgi:hypothetical protein
MDILSKRISILWTNTFEILILVVEIGEIASFSHEIKVMKAILWTIILVKSRI